ncbi:choice-of-anchor J domain-containing protein [Prevotella dentasini]|uniref:choice-of-anchor J domain-containing protein n=1 Tax=Prevotella dentasini TaxID=589537 RepID=UPI00046958B8|nr:choice-of-anchor J domain-containing protein [Prevotella dentasini]
MTKRLTYLMAGLVAAATALPASAQTTPMNKVPFKLTKTLPGQKSTQQQVDPKKAFPTLRGMSAMSNISPLFSRPIVTVRQAPSNNMLTVNPDLTMWGNMTSENAMGMCSFHPTPAVNFELLANYTDGFFNGGSGLIDDQLHGIYFNTQYASFGFILVYHYAFDTNTWELAATPQSTSDYSLIATETAIDPKTEEVFGQFYTADLQNQEWGVIDYSTLTRTAIAPSSHFYIALGIANDGYAYGVDIEGSLYQIDRKTGVETLKGSTGVEVKNSEGGYYYQSGEIDPVTNDFYWASKDKDGNSQLYTVDLSDGHVTPVGTFAPDQTLTAFTIPAPKTESGAPAAATNLAANFAGAATSGTFQFTAPNKKFDGSDLTGSLKYSVLINGEEAASGNAEAGKQVTTNVNVDEGVVKFSVVTTNEAGSSPKAKLTTYAGYDVPATVSNLKFKVEGDNKVTLTWDAPTAGLHNGYLGNLTYDVYRNTGGKTEQVADGISGTTFTETLPNATLANYSYSVCAVNTTRKSALITSEGQIIGNAFEVPFFDDFATEADSKIYTIIDKNTDGSTWEWMNHKSKNTVFRYRYNQEKAADDWLISPPINLKKGKVYNVSFKACAGSASQTERMEVKWGADNTAEAMTGNVLPPTDLTTTKYQVFEQEITPTADGTYYLGFHAISDRDKLYLFLDSISIESTIDENAPDAVQNLKVTPAPAGELKANISFKAPTRTIKGATLANITKLEVKNGTRLVKSFENPAPGAELSLTDEEPANGFNTYTVIAYNEYNNGRKATEKVYVGVDVPVMGPVNAADLDTSAKLYWDEVKGANNAFIDPAKVTYSIYDVTDDGNIGDLLDEFTGVNEYTVTGLNNSEGEQAYKQWVLNANNTGGSSDWAIAALVVGKPYTLPFHNSFKGGSLENQFIGLEYSSRNASWNISKEVASDGDGGSLIFQPKEAGNSTILTGKISLKGATAPKLLFDYRGDGADQSKIDLAFQKKDGSFTAPVWANNTAEASSEWTSISVDLPKELANEDYVILRINGSAETAAINPVFVDNIKIADPVQKDAAIELTAPETAKKGQTVSLSVKVTNQGIEKLENAKVTVTVNDKVVKEETIAKSLEMLQEAKIPVTYKTTTLDPADQLDVKATVTVENDLEADNNVASATVSLSKADVPAPKNLKATPEGQAAVGLTWEAPATTFAETTDDFESYEAWSLDLGDWTTVDNDHGKSAGLSESISYGHQDEEYAFMNWQPGDFFQPGALDPHSGTKAAVAIYQLDETGQNFVAADNWLISPHLSGHAQTVSFWVNNVNASDNSYGAEQFDVLASQTDKETASFTKIGETRTQNSGEWTQVSIDLPEGTQYFAIHHITSADQAFIFMIDDAKFESGSGPVGYNIYRDGELVANTGSLSYTDQPAAPGKYEYSVTAVYSDDSESEPAKAEVVTAIQSLNADGETVYNVYTTDGKQILKEAKSLRSLGKGVYIVNGKKVIIK